MKDKNYFNRKRSESKLPTNWLWFYVKIRFPLTIILGAIGLINYFNALDLSQYNELGITIVIVEILLLVVLLILQLYTAVQMNLLTKKGYNSNIILLILELVYYLYVFLVIAFSGGESQDALAKFISYTVFVVCNFIYFNNRKNLFNKDDTTNNEVDKDLIQESNHLEES